MIQRIIDSVFEQPEFECKKDKYAMNIMVREPILVHVFFNKGASVFIKIATKQINLHSGIQKLRKEYDACLQYSESYPNLLPVPILFKQIDSYDILVTEGIRHDFLNLNNIFQTKQNSSNQFQKFLIGKERIIYSANNDLNKNLIAFDQALNLLPDYLIKDIQKISMAHDWNKILGTLPVIPQHGDLTINNIGLAATGLIIFDWEDYALVNIPGFDLSTLLASGCNFDTSKLISIIEEDTNKLNGNSFLRPIILGLGIEDSQFYDLILINLVIFHQLKSEYGYGSIIIESVKKMLKQLIAYMIER